MAFEELGGIQSSGEYGSQGKESGEALSDAAKELVAEQARASKKVATSIQKSKAQNFAYAEFLVFLLSQIKSEKLITLMWKLFFTVKDPYHEITYTKKTTNYPIMIGLFVPFFWEKVIEYKMKSLYAPIFHKQNQLTIEGYLNYLTQLISHMKDQNIFDQGLFVETILLVVDEFHLLDVSILDAERLTTLKNNIQRTLSL